MTQQVNLLAPMFRKQRALFSARVSLAICALVTLALALIYVASAWRGSALAGEQARLEQQRNDITARLNELAAQFQGNSRNKSLDQQVEKLAMERDRKLQALAALSQRELGNTRGFSPHFVGLARQRLNGLWLTKIEVSAAGTQMALEGVTLSEELIPQYLQKLGGEQVFAGTAFEEARLERKNDGGNQLEFVLRTQAGGRSGARP
jgi:cell division protein FtsB